MQGFLDNNTGFLPPPPSVGGTTFDVGVAVPTGDIRAVMFVNGAGAVDTEVDSGALGATGVRLDRLKIAEHSADNCFLGHFDHNSSTTDYQIQLQADGDTFIKAPGASSALTLIGGDSGTGSISLFVNASTSRLVVNSTGIGVFGTTPAARSTGWAAITNPVSRKTFDTTTVTTSQLAEFVGTLSEQLKLHGWIST